MRKPAIAVVMVLAICTSAFSAKETVEQLKARLPRANEGQRIDICLQIARQQLDNADKLYSDGKVDQAQAAVTDIVTYLEQAGETASKTGKKVKKAEIMVREISNKLKDIKRSLNFDDQPPVQDAVDHLEKVRTQLLSSMFGKNNQ
jgi:soluble cytochrome b562